jgi:hypothetical protein
MASPLSGLPEAGSSYVPPSTKDATIAFGSLEFHASKYCCVVYNALIFVLPLFYLVSSAMRLSFACGTAYKGSGRLPRRIQYHRRRVLLYGRLQVCLGILASV